MKLYCSREKLRDLRNQRDAIVEDFNRRKAVYDEQEGNFKSAYASHEENVLRDLKSQLSNEIKSLPGVEFHVVKNDNSSNGSAVPGKEYGIKILYQSKRYNDATDRLKGMRDLTEQSEVSSYHYGWSSSNDYGFNWVLFIRWVSHDGATFILKKPVIKADRIDEADYDVLAATYDLLTKISTIDWATLLENANINVPTRAEYITEPYPGNAPDTTEIDKLLSKSQLEDYIGEDAWIKADYYATGNTRYPDKDVYIRIVSEGPTKAYYYGYMINSWTFWSGYHTDDDRVHVSQDAYDRVVNPRRVKKLRKAGIQIHQPLEVLSTDELFDIGD